ncbi:MAG: aminotransferase class I/II-fold pyridoxal phosphate-dependent enzyme [Bacteroidia bacterium]|nr:aminotransferase class I/II-fold pyridoxal phosphate-dependent enzyme [Bacteroidia bacterium]
METPEFIPLTVPNLGEAEQRSVSKWLEAGWVSSAGPAVEEFEEKLAAYCGSRFAIATQSGTSALHLALLVAGVQPGELVLLPNLTFIASANAIRYTGAQPLLVDIRTRDWQTDLDLVESFLREKTELREGNCYHLESGKRLAALMPVHVLGYLGEMERWVELSEAYQIPLVEDAAEAMGSRQDGRHAGTFGLLGALSFNGNKIMTTGGGGAVLTQNAALAAKVRHLATQARIHPDEYLHDAIGYNYRMTSLAAALGLAQLERMEEFLQSKAAVDRHYREAFSDLDQVEMPPLAVSGGNFWMFTLQTPAARQLEDYLYHHQIQARKLWVPLNRQPMYRDCLYLQNQDNSLRIYENSLSLPSSTGISESELSRVAETVRKYFQS